jgi:glycine cleavage system H protein
MSNPAELLYSKSHEWTRIEGDTATCGITHHAQAALGDVVHVELPSVGDDASKGSSVGEIESVKAVSDIYAPVSGEVVGVNEALDDSPEDVNADPYGKGWLFKIQLSDKSELNGLMSAADYEDLLAAEG